MKKYFGLLIVFIACSGYIFYTSFSEEELSNGEGDAPIHQLPLYVLGDTVEEPKNDTMSIGKIQTSYVKYTKGDIDFDTMIEENSDNLRHVLNYPFSAMPGYLFSVGYDEHSATQFYYQSNQEETRTVILKVVYNEKSNEVSKIYDGEYLKLVSVDEDNPKQLLTYNINNEENIIVVGE